MGHGDRVRPLDHCRSKESSGADDAGIALVGIGCRFPGGSDNPKVLWRHLCERQDAIVRTPVDRWDVEALEIDERTRRPVRQGGFIQGVDLFDAPAFGISRREAREMDPQQRLLAEVTWEALADAGIAPAQVAGSRMGVFLGISNSDYGRLRGERLPGIDAFSGTGNALSVAANRLSYLLDARGLSMAIDTACSSSLVAMHQARLSLLRGEIDSAIVGGVNLILSPTLALIFARAGVMAADGRCKTFDACADGYVRGEGVGVVVLKPWRDAVRDRDRVYALVCGSAVNQDGRTNGLLSPNRAAQVDVVRAAQASGGIHPADVGYIELHGTGTLVGDAVEAGALGEVFAGERSAENPCAVGSVKTNIGHLESAAGIAGVIKTALMIHHGQMPASLHHHETSPQIDLLGQRLTVVDELTPWPESAAGRVAGVSSFGFGGTNAHVVLRSAPPITVTHQPSMSGASLLVASARTRAGLQAVLRGHIDRLRSISEDELAAYCAAAALRREHLAYRVAAVGGSIGDLVAALRAHLAEGNEAAGELVGHGDDGVVFVFPGQGKQWWPLGTELFERWPVFAGAITECEEALRGLATWSLRDLLETGGEDPDLFRDPSVLQPATTAVQIALAKLWRSWGIKADFVVGHSHGEIAAAHVAGSLHIRDAMRVSFHRGVAIKKVVGRGLMAVVGLGPEQANQVVSRVGGQFVAVASYNGPKMTVLSGAPGAIRGIVGVLDKAGVFASVIETVDFASHSPQMDGPSAELKDAVADLEPTTPSVEMVSTVTGQEVVDPLDADYWARNLRDTVRFTAALNVTLDKGAGRFIEVSGHPAVRSSIHEVLDARETSSLVVQSLHNARGGAESMLTNLGALYTAGSQIDWSGVFPDGAPTMDLPSEPWERQSYWLADVEERRNGGRPERNDKFDTEVWQAVDSGDVVALAGLLGIDDQMGHGHVEDALPVLEAWLRRRRVHEAAGGKRYEVFWKPFALRETTETFPVTVLVSENSSDDHVTRAVVEALGGNEVETIEVPATQSREDMVGLIRPAVDAAKGGPLVSLLGLDQSPVPGRPGMTRGVSQTHLLAQALHDLDARCQLWLLTHGSVATQRSERLASPEQAMVWGLGRAIGLEFPGRWGGLVDLDEDFVRRGRGAGLLRTLLAEPCAEDQLAIRAGRTEVRRLRSCLPSASRTPWVPEGSVLLTGATGQLGRALARHLALRGAPHLVLLSRRGMDAPRTRELAEELRTTGTRVDVIACDVADREALRQVLEALEAAGDQVRSVFHLAGDVSLVAPVSDTSVDDIARIMAAKVAGAVNLDALLPANLERFVLFSSITGVWGSASQSGYSAANAFLSALAQHRRAQGRAATSVEWGPWEGAAHDEHQELLASRGLLLLDESTALAGLDTALDNHDCCVVVADMDWELFARAYTAARPRPFLDEIVVPGSEAVEPANGELEDQELIRRVGEAEPASRLAILEEACHEVVARSLRVEVGEVKRDAPLTDAGVDSLIGLEIRGALQKLTGRQLPATLVWRRPTVVGIAEFIAEQMGLSSDKETTWQAPDERNGQGQEPRQIVTGNSLDDLDDAEIEQMLRARLAEFE
ncbi:type I polyketide synthase [Tessaracoccus sp. OH4464_COT-324]|uniref:type I polyketide synthase n=1 Tax=Tessaracoccus sp. OH4464_COT-324 TaxID=2491059 RepID=UPI000F63675D|nr:SDR family NAD(P)-dependent oxidoreductase [Tessaracoccus sp. OH4464_COT-324]